MNRISFEDMAMNLALVVSQRSEDPHQKVGVCILDKNGRVLSLGYNGIRPKDERDNDFWNYRENRRKYIIHAETNALSCITRYDNPYILASTLLPCSCCAINIASYGIEKVLYLEDYKNDQSAYDALRFHNIELKKYEPRS
jgi:dCMP deaminase